MRQTVDHVLGELREHFVDINARKFGGVLPQASIVVNSRLRALTGRIFYDDRLIELSLFHLTQPNGREQAFKTLEHEMLHLYLDTLGQPAGHTREFKRLAQELDIPVWHGMAYPKNRRPQANHVYECPACAKRIERNRRLSMKQRSACGDCCRLTNGGRFDERFVMRFVETIHPVPLMVSTTHVMTSTSVTDAFALPHTAPMSASVGGAA